MPRYDCGSTVSPQQLEKSCHLAILEAAVDFFVATKINATGFHSSSYTLYNVSSMFVDSVGIEVRSIIMLGSLNGLQIMVLGREEEY